jgi:hypothetical protein
MDTNYDEMLLEDAGGGAGSGGGEYDQGGGPKGGASPEQAGEAATLKGMLETTSPQRGGGSGYPGGAIPYPGLMGGRRPANTAQTVPGSQTAPSQMDPMVMAGSADQDSVEGGGGKGGYEAGGIEQENLEEPTS